MNYPVAVRRVERSRHLDPDRKKLRERKRTFVQPIGERLTFEQLHDEVLDAVLRAHVVNGADMRMRERRDRSCLAFESSLQVRAVREMGREDLDRHISSETRVLRFVDLPHPARAERREDLVGAEARPGGERHLGSTSKSEIRYPNWRLQLTGRARQTSSARPSSASWRRGRGAPRKESAARRRRRRMCCERCPAERD